MSPFRAFAAEACRSAYLPFCSMAQHSLCTRFALVGPPGLEALSRSLCWGSGLEPLTALSQNGYGGFRAFSRGFGAWVCRLLIFLFSALSLDENHFDLTR